MGLKSYAFREFSSSRLPVIVHFARFLAVVDPVDVAIPRMLKYIKVYATAILHRRSMFSLSTIYE